MKRWILIVLTILSFCLVIVGFAHIPLLSIMGVDVYAIRGILVYTALPIVVVFSLPFAFCVAYYFKNRRKKNGDKS